LPAERLASFGTGPTRIGFVLQRCAAGRGVSGAPRWVLPKNTLTGGSNAFVFFGRSPQWVRFFEWPGGGAEGCVFMPEGENSRETALMQVSFDKAGDGFVW
jgi:hypothetical protein